MDLETWRKQYAKTAPKNKGKRRPSGRWALRFDYCKACTETARPHQAYGLCTRCYERYRRKHPKLKQAAKKAGKKYRAKLSAEVKKERKAKAFQKFKNKNNFKYKSQLWRAARRRYFRQWLIVGGRMTNKIKEEGMIVVMDDGKQIKSPILQSDKTAGLQILMFRAEYEKLTNDSSSTHVK